MGIGGSEMLLILVAVLLLFGSKKLPELARGLGKGIKEFKQATDEIKREISNAPIAKDIIEIKEDFQKQISSNDISKDITDITNNLKP